MHGAARPTVLDSHTRFELLGKLGEGAHGEVFEAVDRAHGTRVAIKALRDTSPQSILRFKREFRSLATLHHVNLVELRELFEDGGRWFFSMELVAGQDFLSYVRGSVFTASERSERLRSALHQLGCGLSALHRAGKIHRDIKPSNIRVQQDGRVVLLDFGLVAPTTHASVSDVERVVGSVAYMAPEQANARAPTPAADCYAIGVLLYECLVDEQPFTGSVLEVLSAKQARPVVVPAQSAARWPADLVDLCHELCRIDPAQRATVDELIARSSSAGPTPRPTAVVGSESKTTHTACFGRDTELALLERALGSAASGSLRKVRLCGASGLGKTALLRAFGERLARRSDEIFVLSGSCNEQERVTHKAFDAAIDELGRKLERASREHCARLVPKHVTELVSLFPVLGRLLACADRPARALPPDPVVLRQRAYAGLRDLLHRMSERATVVIILDDLHWSDAESLELLDALTRAPDAPPLLLLASMWPAHECSSELRARLERTFDTDDALQLDLGVLPRAAAVELARQLLIAAPSRDQHTAERIAEAAAYHPLFIEVLARAAAPVGGVYAQLEQALWNEICALSADAQRLLELIAVAGAEIAHTSLAEAAGLRAEQCAEALSELRWSRLARVQTLSVCVSHTKIRGALLAHMDAETVRQHHFALAQAFARGAHRDPEALALHWLAAGQPRPAADCFAHAAERAQHARAFDHAAQLYRSALDALAASDAELRARWLKGWASALAQAGRSAEAAEGFVAAAHSGETAQTRELLQRAAEHYLRAGMVREGLKISRTLLTEIGESLAQNDSAALASLLWHRARVSMRDLRLHEQPASAGAERERYACDLLWSLSVPLTSLDFVRGQDLHFRCLARALRLGDPARVARSLSLHALYMEGNTPDGQLRVRGLLATAESLAQRVDDPYLNAFSQMCHSTFQLLNGEPARALAMADAAATLFEEECSNAPWELGLSRINSLTALSLLGRFRELAARFTAASEEAKAHGNLHGFATLVTMNRCSIDLVADRVDSCRSQLQRLMDSCPADWHLQHTFALGAHVLLDLYVGGDAAHARLSASWSDLRHQMILTSERFRIFFLFARGLAALAALLASPRERHARIRLVRSCAARLARERLVDAQAGAHVLRAQLAAFAGDLSSAVAEYRVAAEVWGRVGMYGAHIVNLRIGEIIGGDEGAALIAGCMRWAEAEGIRRPEQFFRVWCPVS